MIPGRWHCLDQLPKTANRKLDRTALRQRTATVSSSLGGGGATPPRTEIEAVLAGIWATVLQRNSIDIHADFFELGGHSFLALQAMEQLRQKLAVSLPLTALFRYPTVAAMARHLSSREETTQLGRLLLLRGANRRDPLFFIHAIGGDVLDYAVLARELVTDRPVFGLRARGLDEGDPEPHATIEAMAADYLAEIKHVQSQGPYFLAGYSLGGMIAFEMARQLETAGETDVAVALLDSDHPWVLDFYRERDETLILIRQVEALAQTAGINLSLDADELRALDEEARLRRVLDVAAAAALDGAEVGFAAWLRIWRVYLANYRAAARYRPGSFGGRLLFFGGRNNARDTVAGWPAHLTSTFVTIPIEGDHQSCMQLPHVGDLAHKLSRFLD